MAQIFHPAANSIAKVSILGAVVVLGLLSWAAGVVHRSAYYTEVGHPRNQPVPFSHEHHVRGLGIDCRYCHTSVETSSFAGIPPTKTCMTCHSVVWRDAPILRPVHESWETGRPIAWTRVHDLPDYVYFDHSIHIAKGVGCSSCHGRVDKMPIMWKQATLHMEWCLECHRHPEQFVRPRDQIYNMDWLPPPDQEVVGAQLVEQYDIRKSQIINCSVCHR